MVEKGSAEGEETDEQEGVLPSRPPALSPVLEALTVAPLRCRPRLGRRYPPPWLGKRPRVRGVGVARGEGGRGERQTSSVSALWPMRGVRWFPASTRCAWPWEHAGSSALQAEMGPARRPIRAAWLCLWEGFDRKSTSAGVRRSRAHGHACRQHATCTPRVHRRLEEGAPAVCPSTHPLAPLERPSTAARDARGLTVGARGFASRRVRGVVHMEQHL